MEYIDRHHWIIKLLDLEGLLVGWTWYYITLGIVGLDGTTKSIK